MGFNNKYALALGALAMTASAVPATAAPAFHGEQQAKSYSDSYSYRGRHRHRDRVDAGDILTGIGILAGIAIIADAASKKNRNDAPPPPVYYPEDDGYDAGAAPVPGDYNEGGSHSNGGGNGIGIAVDACSIAAERKAGGDAHVDEIRSASRDGNGWRVEGSLTGYSASGFTCGATGGVVDFIQLES